MPAIQAYARYQSIRHRLPQVRRAAPALAVSGLEEIAEQFDVFLFDAYGVLNVGSSAIAGTAEVVAALQAQGKECFVVSNAAGFEKNFYLGKYSGLGYDFALENIVTSRDALLEALAEYPRQLTWGRIGAAEHQTDLADYQIIDQDAPQFLQADGFLFFSPHRWNTERQAALEAALINHPRPVLLGNPDLITPLRKTSSIEAGKYALFFPDAVHEKTRVFGKPFPAIYDIVVKRLAARGIAFQPERCLMLGDTLHTDILGGNAYGIKTALLYGHGFFKDLDYRHYIADSGISPDFVMAQVGKS